MWIVRASRGRVVVPVSVADVRGAVPGVWNCVVEGSGGAEDVGSCGAGGCVCGCDAPGELVPLSSAMVE